MHQPELTTSSSVDHAISTPAQPVNNLTYNIEGQYCSCQVKKVHKCPKCGKQKYVDSFHTQYLVQNDILTIALASSSRQVSKWQHRPRNQSETDVRQKARAARGPAVFLFVGVSIDGQGIKMALEVMPVL